MPKQNIDDRYLREFFGIPEGPDGDREIAEVRGKLERLQYTHGQDICKIDGEPDGMFFLESGTAIVLDRDGQQINVMHQGQYFGEYGVLSGQRRLSTVRSHGKTVVYRLGGDDMIAILQRHPETYGELMKRVYGQVSHKHKQLIALSRMRRGVMQYPSSQSPLTPKRMVIQYGLLAVLFLLSAIFLPRNSAAPVFLLPMALMLVYVLVTHRTLESLVVSGMYAALLVWRSGLSVSYADALMETMGSPDNVFTVLVMALTGSVVSLIEASGAVTGFKKLVDRKVKSPTGARFALFSILLITAIDDCLNMLCASSSTRTVSDEQRIPREDSGVLLSFLPTVLCSFIPISLWGIFVIGTINPSTPGQGISLFCKSIPFNFYSIIVLVAMLLFCVGRLPRNRRLKDAEKRVGEGGELWPEGSERYLQHDDTEVWGKIANLLLPVVVLAVASLLLRSIYNRGFIVDSACGLVFVLIFMFLLYCAQGLMSPEQFIEHLINGIQSMALPIILYLLTMCFSSLLDKQAMGQYFDEAVVVLEPIAPLLPAALFLVSTLLTLALGSSWAMYAIGFPVAIHLANAVGINLPLCIGAVCAAGIAGEKNCLFTSDSASVGEAIGCEPGIILRIRLNYSFIFSLISLAFYAAAGFIL